MLYIKRFLGLVIILSLLFVFGCSNITKNNQIRDDETEDEQISFGLIASEKTLPTDFYETAFKRETTPLFYYLVKKVVNQSEFEETWNKYGLENSTPNVELNKKNVIFIGVEESGSCPYKIESIKFSQDNKTIKVALSKPDGACTSDATPRTFAIEVNKEISRDLNSVVIVQSGTETTIPID